MDKTQEENAGLLATRDIYVTALRGGEKRRSRETTTKEGLNMLLLLLRKGHTDTEYVLAYKYQLYRVVFHWKNTQNHGIYAGGCNIMSAFEEFRRAKNSTTQIYMTLGDNGPRSRKATSFQSRKGSKLTRVSPACKNAPFLFCRD